MPIMYCRTLPFIVMWVNCWCNIEVCCIVLQFTVNGWSGVNGLPALHHVVEECRNVLVDRSLQSRVGYRVWETVLKSDHVTTSLALVRSSSMYYSQLINGYVYEYT